MCPTRDRTPGGQQMRMHRLSIGAALLLLLALSHAADAAQRSTQKRKARPAARSAPAVDVVDMRLLQTQVMLDRAGYSPGEIDARSGVSTDRALAAYTKAGGRADALPQDAV